MKSYILLPNEHTRALPQGMPRPDVRYPESLVRYFLERFTQEGDVVFDPFAGFGTTLHAAEAMGRIPFGIERNTRRFQYAQSQLKEPGNFLHGDSRQLACYALPPFDFSMTSPPYMSKHDKENPLTTQPNGGGYEQYLSELRDIYAQMKPLMKENARAVIEISNLKLRGEVTTLAWDVAAKVSEVLRFEGEIVVAWEESYGYGYEHSYCLVFKPQ